MKQNIPLLLLLFIVFYSCQNPSQTDIAEGIESFLESSERDSSLINAYAENNFRPIWTKSGGLKKNGKHFLEALDEIQFDGLEKGDYFTQKSAQLLEDIKDAESLVPYAELEIAMSRAFLALAADLNIGKVDPQSLNIEWKMDRKKLSFEKEAVLKSITDGKSPKKLLEGLRPDNEKYTELRSLLQNLFTNPFEASSPIKPLEKALEVGEPHPSVPMIKHKLWLLGDLKEKLKTDIYEEAMQAAVIRFQERHGLVADGIIGTDFIQAINFSHTDLVTKTKVNLERLRWLPDFTKSDKNKVIVNIPDYHLFYVSNNDTVFTAKTIVGKDYRKTPVFKAEMTHLVFSPTWTLPETILWEDVIPSIQKDLGYLEKNNMQVLDYQEEEIDHKDIDWKNLEDLKDFPYLIRQRPGAQNPLGKVKFMFPNDYSIYIHDSPAKSLFSRDERTFSSGCIRMENPDKFAAILLEGAGDWDERKIASAMNLEEEKKIDLAQSQEVWIVYLTVWDKSGKMQVREDIYGMDQKLAEAMSFPLLGTN